MKWVRTTARSVRKYNGLSSIFKKTHWNTLLPRENPSRLSKTKPQKPKLTTKQRVSLRLLHDYQDLTFLPAEKGCHSGLEYLDLQGKTVDLIEAPNYKIVTRDPLNNNLINTSGLPDDIHKTLRQRAPVAPRIYGMQFIALRRCSLTSHCLHRLFNHRQHQFDQILNQNIKSFLRKISRSRKELCRCR